jgi:uncharacterized protein
MEIKEMTDRECRAMLAGTHLARLACALNNQPYIVPIHVDFDDAFLYGFATLGQKIEWMRQNPLVCLEIDEITAHGQWASVVVFGRYEELPDTPEYEYPRSVAERLFQRHPVWWEPASVPLAGHQQRSPILFRILISRMTGRRPRPEAPETPYLLDNLSDARRPSRLAHVLRRLLGRQTADR